MRSVDFLAKRGEREKLGGRESIFDVPKAPLLVLSEIMLTDLFSMNKNTREMHVANNEQNGVTSTIPTQNLIVLSKNIDKYENIPGCIETISPFAVTEEQQKFTSLFLKNIPKKDEKITIENLETLKPVEKYYVALSKITDLQLKVKLYLFRQNLDHTVSELHKDADVLSAAAVLMIDNKCIPILNRAILEILNSIDELGKGKLRLPLTSFDLCITYARLNTVKTSDSLNAVHFIMSMVTSQLGSNSELIELIRNSDNPTRVMLKQGAKIPIGDDMKSLKVLTNEFAEITQTYANYLTKTNEKDMAYALCLGELISVRFGNYESSN